MWAMVNEWIGENGERERRMKHFTDQAEARRVFEEEREEIEAEGVRSKEFQRPCVSIRWNLSIRATRNCDRKSMGGEKPPTHQFPYGSPHIRRCSSNFTLSPGSPRVPY